MIKNYKNVGVLNTRAPKILAQATQYFRNLNHWIVLTILWASCFGYIFYITETQVRVDVPADRTDVNPLDTKLAYSLAYARDILTVMGPRGREGHKFMTFIDFGFVPLNFLWLASFSLVGTSQTQKQSIFRDTILWSLICISILNLFSMFYVIFRLHNICYLWCCWEYSNSSHFVFVPCRW